MVVSVGVSPTSGRGLEASLCPLALLAYRPRLTTILRPKGATVRTRTLHAGHWLDNALRPDDLGTLGAPAHADHLRAKAAQNDYHSVYNEGSLGNDHLFYTAAESETEECPCFKIRLSDRMTCPNATEMHWSSRKRPHPLLRFQTNLYTVPHTPTTMTPQSGRATPPRTTGRLWAEPGTEGGGGPRAKPKLGGSQRSS